MGMKIWDWIIVGGGIHGTYLAGLLKKYNLAGEMTILDPHHKLLSTWYEFTGRTAMKYLRSPGSHSLAESYTDLAAFARKAGRTKEFIEPYNRPSLSLFNHHSQRIIQKWGLDNHLTVDRVHNIQRKGDLFLLQGGKEYYSRRVILAMGIGEQPALPQGALSDPRCAHLFGQENPWPPAGAEKIALIGGGISGCQYALELADKGFQVTIYSQHPLKKGKFDGDPALVGPKLMEDYRLISDYRQRRAWLTRYRYPGTLPWDIYSRMEETLEKHTLDFIVKKLDSENWGDLAGFDRIIASTGFAKKPPGWRWLEPFAQKESLAVAPDGYPITDVYLQWMPGLYLTGPLSELETGTSALNIQGAHRSGIRILNHLLGGENIYRFKRLS